LKARVLSYRRLLPISILLKRSKSRQGVLWGCLSPCRYRNLNKINILFFEDSNTMTLPPEEVNFKAFPRRFSKNLHNPVPVHLTKGRSGKASTPNRCFPLRQGASFKTVFEQGEAIHLPKKRNPSSRFHPEMSRIRLTAPISLSHSSRMIHSSSFCVRANRQRALQQHTRCRLDGARGVRSSWETWLMTPASCCPTVQAAHS